MVDNFNCHTSDGATLRDRRYNGVPIFGLISAIELIGSAERATPIKLEDAFIAVHNIDLALGARWGSLSTAGGKLETVLARNGLIVDAVNGDFLALVRIGVELAPMEVRV